MTEPMVTMSEADYRRMLSATDYTDLARRRHEAAMTYEAKIAEDARRQTLALERIANAIERATGGGHG